MGIKQSEKVRRGIALLRANPKLTRYQVALQLGCTPGAFYNSAECKRLFQERKKGLQQ